MWCASFAWSISFQLRLPGVGSPHCRRALKLLQHHAIKGHSSNNVPFPDTPQEVEVPVVELTCWVSVCGLGQGDGKGRPFAKQQVALPLPCGFLGRVFQHALTAMPAMLRTRIGGPLFAGMTARKVSCPGAVGRGRSLFPNSRPQSPSKRHLLNHDRRTESLKRSLPFAVLCNRSLPFCPALQTLLATG